MRLQVNDGGIPSLYNTAMLTVTVNRNLFSPEFTLTDYVVTIFEDQELGVNIEQVTATDADSRSPHNVVRFEAVGSSSGNALTYFAISETDGSVYLRRSLLNDNFNQDVFTVSKTLGFCYSAF